MNAVEVLKDILDYYLHRIKWDQKNVDLDVISRATTGFSGSQIKNLVNVAALNAVKQNRTKAIHEDFEFAIDRIAMGTGKKNMHVTDKDKLLTAYHEGGHTLANLLTRGTLPLHKVTILPRGSALGFTAMLPQDDKYSQSREEMLAFIDVAMGGRIAEEIIYGNEDITTGCSSDLSKASEIAYQYVRHYGMNDNKILLSARKKDLSDGMNFIIDQQVQALLKGQLLHKNLPLLHDLAKKLVEKETMSAQEVRDLMKSPSLNTTVS